MVNLERLTFPVSDFSDDPPDPLEPALIDDLPEADVIIARLTVGEEDYGSWQFQIRPQPLHEGHREGVVFENVSAEIRGVLVHAPVGVVWRREDNTSRFVGNLSAGNLAEVLPLWDYAPSLETKSATLSGDFSWAHASGELSMAFHAFGVGMLGCKALRRPVCVAQVDYPQRFPQFVSGGFHDSFFSFSSATRAVHRGYNKMTNLLDAPFDTTE